MKLLPPAPFLLREPGSDPAKDDLHRWSPRFPNDCPLVLRRVTLDHRKTFAMEIGERGAQVGACFGEHRQAYCRKATRSDKV